MVLTLEYKLKPLANLGTLTGPSQTREELHAAWCALEALTDPILQGEGKLTLGEYPGSYWIAKRLQSTPTDEADYPAMADVQLEFAVTGMAYSVATSTQWVVINSQRTTFTVTSDGDALAYPCWNFYAGTPIINGGVTITNETSGESVAWSGLMAPFDELQFILDTEYGEPGTVVRNGYLQGGVVGPVWPHLLPGENVITVSLQGGLGTSGPSALLEVVWRDRFNRGQVTVPPPATNTVPYPNVISINISDASGYGNGGTNNPAGALGSYSIYGYLTDVFKTPIANANVDLFYNWESPSPFPQGGPLATTVTNSKGLYEFTTTPGNQKYHNTPITANVYNNQPNVTVATLSSGAAAGGFSPGDTIVVSNGAGTEAEVNQIRQHGTVITQ